ncbi:MAG TPA: hypothetical protein VNY73_10490, partial [Bacteroidia bacterium]|nr:hypothetical protein [Bacteroidia bacterium]
IIFLFVVFAFYCLVVHFYSVYKNPILQFSVLLIASPCIIIVVANGISFISEKFFVAISFVLMAAIIVQTVFVKKYYSLGIKQGVRSAIVETIDAKQKYGKDNVTAIYNTEPTFVEHYFKEFKQQYACLNSFDSVFQKPTLLGNYLRSLKEEYIVLSDPDAVNLERVKTYFPYVIKHDEGFFKNVFLLSKKNTGSMKDETVVSISNIENKSPFNFPDNYKKEGKDILIDSLDEWPFYVWANINSLLVVQGQWVVCNTTYIPLKPTENLSFDFCVKEKDSTLFYSSRNFRDFYMPGDSIQHGFSSIFMGTDLREWQEAKLECYFWNQSKKRYVIKDLNLKILNINPHKYSIWD